MKIRWIALAGMLASSPAVADDTVNWKQVGAWQVMVDTTVGNGCFVMTIDGPTAIRVGFQPSDGLHYLMFANEAWRSLEPGKSYPIVLQFDRHNPWDAQATAYSFSGLPTLAAQASAPELFHELAKSKRLVLRYQDREIARVSLAGSRAALAEMMTCQAAMDEAVPDVVPESDPFKRSGGSDDPFA